MPNMGFNMPKMGTIEQPDPLHQPASMADSLFSSTRQRVLGHLFGQPERSFFANELIGLVGAGSGAVQRELKRLEMCIRDRCFPKDVKALVRTGHDLSLIHI